MRFDHEVARQFAVALKLAFRTRKAFGFFLEWRLNIGLDDVSADDVIDAMIWNAITHFQERNETENLVAAALEARPSVPEIQAVAARVFERPVDDWETLERELTATVPDVDPAIWRTAQEMREPTVCSIHLPLPSHHTAVGTGFLIGADLVLTARHVLDPAIDGNTPLNRVTFRFDYKKLLAGGDPSPGVTYGLAAKDWLVASDRDLDFATVRLDAPAGEEPIGSREAEPDAPRRGWIALPTGEMTYAPDTPLLILHHPMGTSLKLAMKMVSIGGGNSSPRLRHRTNTAGGSSGAPCFDIDWNLIALHVATEPLQPFNLAVPIGPIADMLRANGVVS